MRDNRKNENQKPEKRTKIKKKRKSNEGKEIHPTMQSVSRRVIDNIIVYLYFSPPVHRLHYLDYQTNI